jgi:hypothetical protein
MGKRETPEPEDAVWVDRVMAAVGVLALVVCGLEFGWIVTGGL